MAHLDDIIQQVDETLERHIIVEMNTLLIALSDDQDLTREDRYAQQQRLRIAIAQKGHGHQRSHQEEEDTRREQLTKGGEIL
ncbi:YdcY family protein [Klebsiella sp. BIGb0407]|uniref:YdcY family protein n=1 Tax=Klebsiella sp. BIGb0407 TaxID=2940603 RepID=UPI0021684E98|nr:YdcY family protein [Klebsiella sp. BIGb0407]MCS3429959.1 vacuolar-type H+-ATPase subunit I/STV1 [Klebsiella sp. BIGb0407]